MTPDLRSELVKIMPRLRRFGMSLTKSVADADDLVQTTCVRVLAREAQLQSEASFVAWIYRIMRNLWFDEMRSRGARPHEAIESAGDIVGDDGDAIAERNDTLAAVRRALAELPEGQRSALILVCVDGMNYAAAAIALGVPVGTIASRVARGRRALHEDLQRRAYGSAPSAAMEIDRQPLISSPARPARTT